MARTPAEILAGARTIALVGASPRPERPSNSVMGYLLRHGYRVIPVRPMGPAEILGQRRVASLAEIEEPIDLVDVFRRSEFCPDVARQAVAAGAGDREAGRDGLRRGRVHGDRPPADRLKHEGPPMRPLCPVGVPGFEPGTS